MTTFDSLRQVAKPLSQRVLTTLQPFFKKNLYRLLLSPSCQNLSYHTEQGLLITILFLSVLSIASDRNPKYEKML